MKLITKEIDYSLRVLTILTKNSFSTKELAKKTKISWYFLRKILRKLKEKKIVGSLRGKKGKIIFLADPKKLNLLKIIKFFQKKFDFTDCVFKKKNCRRKKVCLVRKTIKEIEDFAEKKLEKINLVKLAN